MNKDAIRNIIESTLKSGAKTPALFDIPKVLKVRSKLESSESIDEIISILEESRPLICKAFGVDDQAYTESVNKIKAQA